jgi:release factor glutamine methyltransferase
MFHYKNLEIFTPKSVYCPREDSILMADVISTLSKAELKKVLEIGCGSGFLSILSTNLGATVTAVDINSDAITTTLKNANRNNIKLTAFQSDLFENVKGKFDLIFFNPPYLPNIASEESIEGNETWADNGVIEHFIKQVNNYLNPNGMVLLLISSLTQTPALELLEKAGFSTETIAKKKIPWEELSIIKATPTRDQTKAI